MKHLAAMNVVAENGVDLFTATPLSKALTEPRFRDGITYTSAKLIPLDGTRPDSIQVLCCRPLFQQDSRISKKDKL